MKRDTRWNDESGAALVTVLFVSILLGTACAFLLSSVGHNSRNSTDVLSETKAYYAAESGLQSTVNVLRFKNVEYSRAVLNSELRYHAVNFPEGMTYVAESDGVDKVVMNSGLQTAAKYKVTVFDPDASRPYTFATNGTFTAVAGIALENFNRTLCVPSCAIGTTPQTKITFTPAGATTLDFTSTSNPQLGSLVAQHEGGGVAVPAGVKFKIEYQMASPRVASRTIRAVTLASAAGAPVTLDFQTQVYNLIGSRIELCSTQTTPSPAAANQCADFSLTANTTAVPLYADVADVEPYRLVVKSTGYGPNGSQKQLEGIIQKNYFDDLSSSSAIAMIGPSAGMVFDAGNGGPRYCGVDGGYEPGDDVPNTPPCNIDENATIGPSVGVTDPNGLPIVNAGGDKATMIPAPDVITDLPSWQQSPQLMALFIEQLKFTAQNSGTYLANGGSVGTPGSHETGRGITFCDGNCAAGPVSGGGILVVTGDFEYHGNFSFNGMIIVTGAGGMHRNGGGGGQIIGNIVIAPYNPADLNAGFLPPRFTTNGGGNSDILFGGTSAAFDGTVAVTNVIIGVAEK